MNHENVCLIQNDEQADEAKQTMENTKMNESIGTEELSPSEVLLKYHEK